MKNLKNVGIAVATCVIVAALGFLVIQELEPSKQAAATACRAGSHLENGECVPDDYKIPDPPLSARERFEGCWQNPATGSESYWTMDGPGAVDIPPDWYSWQRLHPGPCW